MDQLAPLIGRSPRAVKRFVNVYRILRAGLHREELSAFLGEGGAIAQFPAVIFLLAVLNGSPSLATEMFQQLTTTKIKSLKAFIKELTKPHRNKRHSEWNCLLDLLNPFCELWGNKVSVATIQEWAPRVARYSFRMEMAEELETLL
jgi:hypothetical protein